MAMPNPFAALLGDNKTALKAHAKNKASHKRPYSPHALALIKELGSGTPNPQAVMVALMNDPQMAELMYRWACGQNNSLISQSMYIPTRELTAEKHTIIECLFNKSPKEVAAPVSIPPRVVWYFDEYLGGSYEAKQREVTLASACGQEGNLLRRPRTASRPVFGGEPLDTPALN